MNIGITGVNGFIGSHVSKFLESQGFHVINLDTYLRKSSKKIKNISPRPDWILHFAAKTSVPSETNTFEFYSTNCLSTLKALEISAYYKVPMVYISSYVYGKPEYLPIDEKHRVSPTNPYAISKLLGEKIIQISAQYEDIPIIILRCFNIYGDSFNSGRIISDLLNQVKSGRNTLTINDPSPRRDYLYIKDFSNLMFKVIKATPVTEIYNVGFGKSYSNLELAKIIADELNYSNPIKLNHISRNDEVDDCFADNSLICKTFNWQPEYDLKPGIVDLMENLK